MANTMMCLGEPSSVGRVRRVTCSEPDCYTLATKYCEAHAKKNAVDLDDVCDAPLCEAHARKTPQGVLCRVHFLHYSRKQADGA